MSREFQPFNLETMAGVHPGTRTAVFQRVRVEDSDGAIRWYLLQWYTEPEGAALTPIAGDGEPLEIDGTERESAAQVIGAWLAKRGQRLRVCGTCRWWKPVAGVTVDGLRYGVCTFAGEHATAWERSNLAAQSSLALECPHWAEGKEPDALAPVSAPATVAPIPKAAELDPDRLPWWKRVRVRVAERLGVRRERGRSLDDIVERSGVGAGTEPCLACNGRIANLGALAVETPEGDKQTYSVWRCRSCYSLFLDDWVDRWERLDSLETEESHYRISPAEAGSLLTLIHSVRGGDHPARRHERADLRAKVAAFTQGRERLSHQIRQGR